MLVRMQRKGNPLTLLVGMQTCAATLDNSIEVPQEVKNGATLQSSNRATGDLSKGYEHSGSKGAPVPQGSQQPCAQEPNCGKSPGVHRQMKDKEDVGCRHSGICSHQKG